LKFCPPPQKVKHFKDILKRQNLDTCICGLDEPEIRPFYKTNKTAKRFETLQILID
jgi:hypothetical protein